MRASRVRLRCAFIGVIIYQLRVLSYFQKAYLDRIVVQIKELRFMVQIERAIVEI